MIDTPHIAEIAAQPTAIIRLTIPRAEIKVVMGPAHKELMAAVAAQGITPTGAWFTHQLRLDPATFDFEVGVPVPVMVAAAGRVTAGQLPAATVARTVYHGPYEGLPGAWGEFGKWMKAEGHAAAPDLWECYVAGPEASRDPVAWRTELTWPLKA